MPIQFYENEKIFKLDTAGSSYVIKIFPKGILLNLYYGGYIPDTALTDFGKNEFPSSFSPLTPGIEWPFSADTYPIEYSGFGTSDSRKTAAAIRNADGNSVTDFRYVSHRIYPGKPALEGLPATYASEDEAQTLELTACDEVTGAELVLTYTVFENLSAMARSVRLTNKGGRPMDIEKLYSAQYQLIEMDYDFLSLYGNYYTERLLDRTPLRHGVQSVSSSRGSSSHYYNPFLALAKRGWDEDHGEVYGFNFVYSGSFDITADCDYCETTRVLVGINPDGFRWHLEPGESFQAPEAVSVFTDKGLGEMSRIFHRLYREHLIRGRWKTEKRPLLINSWEAAGMDINEEKLISFAERAKDFGVEMLVMDDGWFGKRDNDTTSLGDWTVDERKFPGGLGRMIEKINSLGLKFGIWFEPEMISPVSELYKAHPDWCLQVPGRKMSIGRHQYVLDMSRADVRDHIFAQMDAILSQNNIAYLKWDFNRNLTEAGSALLSAERGGEIWHRFVLGTYELLERLLKAHPDLLLESCSGGGGRYDAGMLYYSPQIWASDKTDAIERLGIQFGSTLCYPSSAMGAHVSRNSRTGFATRGNVALWGTFGYELDPNNLTEEEIGIAKQQVELYHRTYKLIHEGDLYRMTSPWDDPAANSRAGYCCSWEFVSPDKSEMLYTTVTMRQYPCFKHYVRFKGLDPDKYYKLCSTGAVYSGALLMNAGLNVIGAAHNTGESTVLRFEEVKDEK